MTPDLTRALPAARALAWAMRPPRSAERDRAASGMILDLLPAIYPLEADPETAGDAAAVLDAAATVRVSLGELAEDSAERRAWPPRPSRSALLPAVERVARRFAVGEGRAA